MKIPGQLTTSDIVTNGLKMNGKERPDAARCRNRIQVRALKKVAAETKKRGDKDLGGDHGFVLGIGSSQKKKKRKSDRKPCAKTSCSKKRKQEGRKAQLRETDELSRGKKARATLKGLRGWGGWGVGSGRRGACEGRGVRGNLRKYSGGKAWAGCAVRWGGGKGVADGGGALRWAVQGRGKGHWALAVGGMGGCVELRNF